jgi:hypothetical protein
MQHLGLIHVFSVGSYAISITVARGRAPMREHIAATDFQSRHSVQE